MKIIHTFESTHILIKMILGKLFCLFFLEFCVAASFYREMQCNFSIYFLNYFQHNKLYLQELHENRSKYSESDVKTYGTAVQSHGVIVMVMLDVLRHLNSSSYSKELMAINLYLNNVSNSLDMIGKNDDGTFDRRDNTAILIKGYRLIHQDIEKQLQDYVKNSCHRFRVDRLFVELLSYNNGEDLHPNNLENALKHIKNIILNNIWQVNMNLQTNLLHNSVALRTILLAIKRSTYEDFYPKHLLFYNLMTDQRDFIENSSNQGRKKPKVNEDGQLEDVLDLLRFAKLKSKCPDGSPLTVYDAFRFTKYNFNRPTIRHFEMLVQGAAMRPLMLFIRLYILIFNSSTYLYGFETRHGKGNVFYECMINVGNDLVNLSRHFVDLNLFGNYAKGRFNDMPSKVISLLHQFKQKNIIHFKGTFKFLVHEVNNLLKMNRFDDKFGFLRVENDNIEYYYSKLIDDFEQLKKFTIELEKHTHLFYIVNRTMVTRFKLYYGNSYFLRPEIKAVMCKEDIYAQLNKTNLDDSGEGSSDEAYYDNFDLGDIDDEIANLEISQDEERCHEEDQSEDPTHSYNYMIDYLLFR